MFRPAKRSSSRRLLRKHSDEVSSFTSAILNLIGALYKHWYQSNYIRMYCLCRLIRLAWCVIIVYLLLKYFASYFVIYLFEGYTFKYVTLQDIISILLSFIVHKQTLTGKCACACVCMCIVIRRLHLHMPHLMFSTARYLHADQICPKFPAQ